jgi:hypothetical protein
MNTTDSRPDHDSNTLLELGSSAVLGVSAGKDELYGDAHPGERGNTRAPKFGEWMRGVWASVGNPHRDGMFVRLGMS